MKILLVWNLIPDSMEIYSLDVDEETFARWLKVHGVYGNTAGFSYEHGCIIEEIGLEINQSKPVFSDKNPETAMPPILLQEHSALIVSGFLY